MIVKGLSEREYDANIVIWPIQFSAAGNDLGSLYDLMEKILQKSEHSLAENGIGPEEVTFASPAITDKSAQQYGNNAKPEFRYTAIQTVTVYSKISSQYDP